MRRQDFIEWLKEKGYRHFNDIAEQHNVEEGVDVFYTCRFCPFETPHVQEVHDMDAIYAIDKKMTVHVWANHQAIVTKMVNESRSAEIASKEGQTTLGI